MIWIKWNKHELTEAYKFSIHALWCDWLTDWLTMTVYICMLIKTTYMTLYGRYDSILNSFGNKVKSFFILENFLLNLKDLLLIHPAQ